MWTYRTDPDRAIYQDTTVVSYDRLSHKTETSDVSLNTVAAIPASLSVSQQLLAHSFTSAVGDEGMTGGGYDPVYYYQTVDHRIDLSWQSLEGWGGGDVQVIVDYTGNGFSGSQTRTLSAADGMRSEERRVGKEGRSRWAPYH